MKPRSVSWLPFVVVWLVLLLAVAMCNADDKASSDLPDPPVLESKARLKQHRSGADGQLVPGEEHFLKLIVFWNKVPNAIQYEVQREWKEDGQQPQVATMLSDKNCAGRPCAAMPGLSEGVNTIRVRAQMESTEWTDWSLPANYMVEMDSIGMVPHLPLGDEL